MTATRIIKTPISETGLCSLASATDEPQDVIGEPIIVRKWADGEMLESSAAQKPAVLEVPETQSVLNKPRAEMTDVQNPSEPNTNSEETDLPRLNNPVGPAANEHPPLQPQNDDADIDTRPGG